MLAVICGNEKPGSIAGLQCLNMERNLYGYLVELSCYTLMRQVCIDLGGGNLGMTQKCADRIEGDTRLNQPTRKSVREANATCIQGRALSPARVV